MHCMRCPPVFVSRNELRSGQPFASASADVLAGGQLMLDQFDPCELTSLVLKRVPPRCTSCVLLDMLDATGGQYDYVHLPYDIGHHKNLSLAFVNFLDHETASAALQWLSRYSNFPQGLAPSTQVHWGQIHGLGPNLAHFIARFGVEALDPPYAPYVFLNGVSVARTRDIIKPLRLDFDRSLC